MSSSLNFLRIYRKHSPLTQADIAFLLGWPDYSNVSRCEKGLRVPSIDFLLVYHHLFNSSIELFFEHQSQQILSNLIERIEQLIEDIKKKDNVPKNSYRVKFLEEVITRLTN